MTPWPRLEGGLGTVRQDEGGLVSFLVLRLRKGAWAKTSDRHPLGSIGSQLRIRDKNSDRKVDKFLTTLIHLRWTPRVVGAQVFGDFNI